ncbi:signal peptidase II [Georgenia wutianyii]|uniref:Lipoprotein signal peptidase n=1 Tax=Georgenia wutianyii TaxID=2585135 RepID=A0ABX5VLV5_9MICO|nr:signal peptidase II [Georgenia wutianyii]
MTQQQRRRRGRIALLVALAVGIAVADQVTKYLAEANLTQGVIVPLVGDLLGLQLIYNPGAAFSIATGMTWVFTVISIGVVIVVVRVARRLRSTAWAVALGLLLGGAIGNLYDRLLREPGFARGHVVDFINYNGWFVGNVADIAIVAAAVLIAILALLGLEVDGTRVSDGQEDAEPRPGTEDEDLSEEPLDAEDEFSGEVPRPTDDDVDVATWVSGAPSASEVAPPGAVPVAETPTPDWTPTGASAPREESDRPAAPDQPSPAAEQDEPVPPAQETPRRRPRSRREARLADDGDA